MQTFKAHGQLAAADRTYQHHIDNTMIWYIECDNSRTQMHEIAQLSGS